MVQNVSVDLDSFTIFNGMDKNLCLTVSTELSLNLPDNYLMAPTAVELWNRVRTGAFWIARAGSCSFKLSIGFEDLGDESFDTNLHDQRRQAVVEAFQGFSLWDALGLSLPLDLERLFDRHSDSSKTLVYSVHHDLRHLELSTPPGVTCGSLSAVTTRFQFNTRCAYTKRRLGDHARVCTLKAPPHELRRIARRTTQAFEFRILSPEQQVRRLEHLTHNALNLLLGLKKKPTGVRFLKPFKPPALLDLAPGVWNATSFQDTVARSRSVESISSALANLVSAQSPPLPQRIEALEPSSGTDSQPKDVKKELEKQISALLLRNAYVQRTKLRGARKRERELISNSQSVEMDESQRSSSMEYIHEIPMDNLMPPPTRSDSTGDLQGPNEDLGYVEHDGEQTLLLAGDMSVHSVHGHDESAHAYPRGRDDVASESLNGENSMEDVQSYMTSMTGTAAPMQLDSAYATCRNENASYHSSDIEYQDHIESNLHEVPAQSGTYSGEDDMIQDESNYQVIPNVSDRGRSEDHEGNGFVVHTDHMVEVGDDGNVADAYLYFMQPSQGGDQVPRSYSRRGGAHWLIDEHNSTRIQLLSDNALEPGFIL